jgi:hypothetical protein
MNLWRGITAVVVTVCCMGVVGCATTSAEATAVPIATITTPPDMRGTVQNWEFVDGEGAMLVEGEMADGTEMAAQVRVTGRTQIIRQMAEALEAGQVTHLANGQTVELRFDGPVAESYPVQATAREIVILE